LLCFFLIYGTLLSIMEGNPEFLELSPRARKYVETAFALEELQKAQANATGQGNAEDYDDAIARASLIISITEPDAAPALIEVAQLQEPADRAHQRTLIESLRNEADFGTAITEEDVQGLLDQLPPYPRYSPEVTAFAHDYVDRLGQWVTAVTATDESPLPPPTEPAPADGEGRDGAGSSGEQRLEKPPLTITVYKDRVIQIGEDGEKIPLLRLNKEIHKSSAEEIEIARRRLKALQIICGHEPAEGEKGIPTGDLWRQYTGLNSKPNSGFHAEEIVDLLHPLTYNGQPVVTIYKSGTVNSKRRYHHNGAFSVKFVESNERSGLELPEVFELPDGNVIFGHSARMANLLIRGSETAPIDQQQYETGGIYTEEEAAALAEGPILSGSVSVLRQALLATGFADVFEIRSARKPNREMVYWLEYNGDEAIGRELYPYLYEAADASEASAASAVAGAAGEARAESTLETPEEREKSIHECLSVAEWLVEHQQQLSEAGFDLSQNSLFQASALTALQNSDTIPREETPVEIRLRLENMVQVLADQATLEEVLNKLSVNPEDPRWPLVDFLMAEHPASKKLNAEALQAAFVELDIHLDHALITCLVDWRRIHELSRQEIEKLGGSFYEVFDKIGRDLSRRSGKEANFKDILGQTNKRLQELSQNVYITLWEQDALVEVNNEWVRKRPHDSSARAQRRAFGTAFRAVTSKRNGR
jgi:hypothetical protein